VVQRVSRAAVDVAGERISEIGPGLLALVGVTHDDGPDDAGVMNRSVLEARGEVLVVSQFTIYGDTVKGRRPSWLAAARPEHAEPLVEAVVAEVRAVGVPVATGRFRTEMAVSLVNDGPVTILLEV
jgi:D-tyrosyl-tRNA(Tyr) deacylase